MKIYESDRHVDIPEDLNLTELIHSDVPGLPRLADDHLIAKDNLQNRTLTIGQLRDNAGRMARGLVDQFQPKDHSRWAIILPNSVAYIEAFHAVLWLGGAGCPINHLLKPGEIAHGLTVSKPEFIIVWPDVLTKVLEAVQLADADLPYSYTPKIILAAESGQSNSKYRTLNSYLAAQRLPIPHYTSPKDRLASIHLSSGTTGKSKGVGLSHHNYVANVYQCWAHDKPRWARRAGFVSFTPMVHIANTTIPLFLGPWTGANNIVLSSYEPESFCQIVSSNRAREMQCPVPLALQFLTTDILQRYDLSSIEYIHAGPIPLPAPTLEEFSRKGNWEICHLYGMTEAAPYVFLGRVGHPLAYGEMGTLVPNMQCQLRLENGSDAPSGGPGELWLKGPNMTSGYVDNPDANKTAFDADGWYNTGDVCTISPQGALRVVGRTKELIKYNGFQVSPTELEAYILPLAEVDDCAVGGVWDDELLTELPTAYVVFKDHVKDRMEVLRRIHNLVDDKVSGYKKLRGGVWEVKEIARNPQMKVLRKQLGTGKTGLVSLKDIAKRKAKI